MLLIWLSRPAVETLYRDCTDDTVRNELYRALRSADLFGELEPKVLLVANNGGENAVLAVTFADQAAADRAWERLRDQDGDDVLATLGSV